MLKFVRQKIKNQLWLSLCLVLGIALLVATFCCQPMFKVGSLNKLLQQTFVKYIEEKNEYPTVISNENLFTKDEVSCIDDVMAKLSEMKSVLRDRTGEISIINDQTKIKLKEIAGMGAYQSKTNYFEVTYIPDMLEHARIIKGEDYNTSTYGEGYYPCIIAENTMDRRNVVVGEVIEFSKDKDANGNTLKLVVAGIYEESDSEDLFWYKSPNDSDKEVCVSKESFDEIMQKYSIDTVMYSMYELLDYEKINDVNVDDLKHNINKLIANDRNYVCSFAEIMNKFLSQRKTISIMIWVLELPIFGMVIAFIYMVSGQIVETERGEIAMFKSRGLSRFQVFLMYLLKSFFLSIGGLIVGIPLGYGFCKIAALTTDFLTFDGINVGTYKFIIDMLWYGLVAVLIAIIIVVLPIIKHSKISIVQHKSSYGNGKRMFWEKCYLDIILLVLSLYLLYNFNKSIDDLQAKALVGNTLDPMIFLNTCLFIIAFGLFAVRLMHYLVRLVYAIGKKKWKPVSYVAFLQITRNFAKQNFISVFMILTVSLGLFYANTARTINKNNEDRIEYSTGADINFTERWASKTYRDSDGNQGVRYLEPNINRFDELVSAGICDSYTKVLRYPGTDVSAGKGIANDCVVYGIDTKAFGTTARLKDELQGDTHWYNYLNNLGQKANGAIISTNLAKALDIKVGSRVSMYAYEKGMVNKDKKLDFVVTDIVDAWPGFEQYYYEDGKEKERYLMVVNYATMLTKFNIIPYEIWCDLKDGVSSDDLYTSLKDMDIKLKSFDSSEDKIYTMKNSPEIQITNGMFTLSFIIALVLCGVGFLIYWIASIKQRELLFGVYRAMGLSVKSVNKMLIYEHIFSTLLSVIQGGIVGMTSTFLFAKLFGIVYLPEKSNLDIYINYQVGDIVKLFTVVAIMIVICLLVLRKLISKMNITQALKLGED